MPCKCCVPRCRGNYTVDTKVHVFKFPKDQTLRDAWIRAVPREDLSVTENSRVCELHFGHEDIIREASHTDESTGRTITVPLSHVRLRPDAVPSKFPSCPTYLSREATRREDPDSKRARMEHAAMQKAVAESEETFNRAHEEDKVHSLGELIGHLRSKEMKFWNIIEKDERPVIIHIVDDETPWLKYSVCVKGDMSVTLHVMKTAVKKLGANLVVPEIADSKKGIVELLEGIEKWDGDLISNSVEEICEAICLLLDQLSTSHAEDDADSIRFLREQHNLFSFEATATFIDIILKWWKIVNVKTPWKGKRLRDQFQQPVFSVDNDPKIDFLHLLLKWLDEWKNKGLDKGTLTKETHAALEHTTYALVELASYVVVEQLATQPELLLMPEQRQVITKLTLHLLANEEPSDFDACENGHTSESVLKDILRCSTNVLLKNFCGKLNVKLLDAADK
ncbi:hypothetical protein HPB47_016738 [Ixodes persulcatus]|uniref:Uncharacterized protein n=1 Tax=Ixodes persulcatus TaxID=34615 RepID=A0AC60QRB6_IXOPE|nr:hypothetical protein HPB47_016738 [Ixodes persulcatus]